MLAVGTKVRVRSDLIGGKAYKEFHHGRLYFTREMEKFCGKIVTIKTCVDKHDECYEIVEDDDYWTWAESFFDILDNRITIDYLKLKGL